MDPTGYSWRKTLRAIGAFIGALIITAVAIITQQYEILTFAVQLLSYAVLGWNIGSQVGQIIDTQQAARQARAPQVAPTPPTLMSAPPAAGPSIDELGSPNVPLAQVTSPLFGMRSPYPGEGDYLRSRYYDSVRKALSVKQVELVFGGMGQMVATQYLDVNDTMGYKNPLKKLFEEDLKDYYVNPAKDAAETGPPARTPWENDRRAKELEIRYLKRLLNQ